MVLPKTTVFCLVLVLMKMSCRRMDKFSVNFSRNLGSPNGGLEVGGEHVEVGVPLQVVVGDPGVAPLVAGSLEEVVTCRCRPKET